ncbi:hypothetical protein M378DRAFT_174801 [Amanita muscaria Koide BX008]|uniref:Bromo domain-containing protein n=1 Tax=Amanita muscaria (strain Koide BX008) TaxID=946122 RepID=A0A0C2TVY9_AMAMK|nr:hypothetical protein M378DRAFT_174801 [Amanita muscaria Koide BX008]
MKREIEQADGTAGAEGSRSKRRKEEGTNASSDVDVPMAEVGSNENEENGQGESTRAETVKEQGLRLWQIVKVAVNKEGRTLSTEFLKRPPKRIYPDYYQIIQQPIALEDIKKQLDNDAYQSLEAVRVDFELCFMNAKTYNMKESDIWKDAKDLLMVPSSGDGDNADGTGDKGKSKAPNLNRLIKARLQKLVEKADDTGRILSTEFMELPSKKEWPIYYKQIKRPQCLEYIFKRIKRKEYLTSAEFAADVELVFSNAMTFNQEHTQIWEDARVLRVSVFCNAFDYFRQLMSDLPPPFALSEYSKPTPKIKIKPQAAQSSLAAVLPLNGQGSTPANLTLRVPPLGVSNPQPPSANAPSLTPSTSLTGGTASTPQVATATQTPANSPATIPQPSTQATQATSQASTSYAHYPNALYHASTVATPGSSASVQKATKAAQSQSPTPSATSGHQLKYATLSIQPNNRKLCLDCRDGVKCWAIRLSPAETGVLIGDVAFLQGEEEESSGEDEAEQELKPQEDEAEDAPIKNGRKKGKSRRKGRPQNTKTPAPKQKTAASSKKVAKPVEVQVRLDGTTIKSEESEDQWTISLPAGSHVLEIGETGGPLWRVYAERPTTG